MSSKITPKYSFVMPAFKGAFLYEAIDSVLKQTYDDFELIVVNDCSPDDLSTIVNKFVDKRVRYYENTTNCGGNDLVAHWNNCVKLSYGTYVILATDDDVYSKDFLEEMDILVDRYPDCDLFRARVMKCSGSDIRGVDLLYNEYISQSEFAYWLYNGMQSGIPHYIFRKSRLCEIGGFVSLPLAWGSDEATALLMSKNGCVNSKNYLVTFRLSNVNISSLSSPQISFKKTLAKVRYVVIVSECLDAIIPDNKMSAYFLQSARSYLKNTRISRISELVANFKLLQLFKIVKLLRCYREMYSQLDIFFIYLIYCKRKVLKLLKR